MIFFRIPSRSASFLPESGPTDFVRLHTVELRVLRQGATTSGYLLLQYDSPSVEAIGINVTTQAGAKLQLRWSMFVDERPAVHALRR